jgi:hypothetical protein
MWWARLFIQTSDDWVAAAFGDHRHECESAIVELLAFEWVDGRLDALSTGEVLACHTVCPPPPRGSKRTAREESFDWRLSAPRRRRTTPKALTAGEHPALEDVGGDVVQADVGSEVVLC